MRKLMIVFLIATLSMTGCFSSPNVDRVEKIQGESIKILKVDEKAIDDNDSENTYLFELDSITMLLEGYHGFYLYDGRILILQDKSEYSTVNGLEYSIIGKVKNNDNNSFEDYKLDYLFSEFHCEKYYSNIQEMNIQLSSNRDKLLHVLSPWSYVINNLPSTDLLSFILTYDLYASNGSLKVGKRKKGQKLITDSISWVDGECIAFTDVNGDIRVLNTNDPSKSRSFELDSIYKTNISYVNNNVVYIKNIELQKQDTEGINYEWAQSLEDVNDLSFSVKDQMIDQIIETSEELNIKNYEISPDRKYIAMYFEDNEGVGCLYIADIENLFTSNIRSETMVAVLEEKVIDLQWSEDSTKLACSTGSKIPSLYVLTIQEHIRYEKESISVYINPIVTNKRLDNLHWNKEGDSLLCVEEKDNKGYVYEIKLK